MKKKLLIIFILFTSHTLFAQIRLGTSFNYGVPLGDFGTINKNGYGVSITSKFQINQRFSLTQNISFLAFGRAGDDLGKFAEAIGLSPSTATQIDLLNQLTPESDRIKVPEVNFYLINMGFEYYILTKKIRPYVGIDLGIYVRDTQPITMNLGLLATLYGQPNLSSLGKVELNGNATNFGIAPSVGCVYDFDKKLSVDLNIKANGIAVPEKKSYATVMTFNLGIFYRIDAKKDEIVKE
jgi:hypothetical protein